MSSAPSWLTPFAPEFQDAVLKSLAVRADRKVACFDADGTLWNEDIGEAMFRWMAAGSLLHGVEPSRDPFDVWAEYESRVRKNRAEGYGWAVQCMATHSETEVRRWSRQLAVAWPNYRPEMVGLIGGLGQAGYEVWIVSASNSWIIQAAAPLVGVDPARGLGIHVEVVNDKLTGTLVQPLTCGAGKVTAIHEKIRKDPDIAVGDSMGDLELLESARHPLVVGRRDRAAGEIFSIASKRRWPTHLF
jgi:HAD superfamily phosphoserine phosphatase-like hydrolase